MTWQLHAWRPKRASTRNCIILVRATLIDLLSNKIFSPQKRFTLSSNESDDMCPYDQECIRNGDCSCDTENLECKMVGENLSARCVAAPVAARIRPGSPNKGVTLLVKFLKALNSLKRE